MNMPYPVYTIQEFAEIFKISRSHANSLTNTGEVPYITLGNCKRITAETIEQLLRQGRTRTGNTHNYRNDNITPKDQNLNTEEQNNG
jgi:hypothetical protein